MLLFKNVFNSDIYIYITLDEYLSCKRLGIDAMNKSSSWLNIWVDITSRVGYAENTI